MNDYDVISSRATTPSFFIAPAPVEELKRNWGIEPMGYQYAGVEYAIRRDHAIIGDEPGLGKTAQGIMLSNAIGAKHTLVVCPASLRLNWEREVYRWSTIPNVITYPILKSRDGVSLDHNYVIVSYDLLRNPSILHALLERPWDHVIYDEAHAIKDPKGNQRTVPICAPDLLPSVARRMTLLTGTLLPNQPIECYNAIRLLNWGAIDNASLEEFREYYYDFGEGWVTKRVYDHVAGRYTAKQEWSKHVRNAPRRMEELQFRLRKHLMVRRLKAQVLHMLPPKRWQPFPLELTAGIRSALKHPGWAEVQRLWEMDPENFDVAASFDGHAATARRELGEAKAPGVAGYVEDMIESGVNKIVIGAWHRSVLAVLRELLTKIVGEQGIVYMDGGTSSGAKQRAVDAFQNDPRVKIMLGQKKPLGEGWTLTAAQDVVDAEIDGTPGVNEQFFDRINRMGQLGSHTTCHIPLVPQTLDEKIINRAVQRSRTIYKALDAA